jgi:hypothetical protein
MTIYYNRNIDSAPASSCALKGDCLAASIDNVYRVLVHYTMLKSYRHKGVKQFAETGSKAGIQPEHANRLRRLLSALDAATCPANMNAPGYALCTHSRATGRGTGPCG